jgi:hypothetical protein
VATAAKPSASRRARRRKEDIGIGLPPRSTEAHSQLVRTGLPHKVLNHLGGSLRASPHRIGRAEARFAPNALLDCRQISLQMDWSKPAGEPFTVCQFWPSRVWASSQYFFQKARVTVFCWPQVMQVKPLASYLGTKTSCAGSLGAAWRNCVKFGHFSPVNLCIRS